MVVFEQPEKYESQWGSSSQSGFKTRSNHQSDMRFMYIYIDIPSYIFSWCMVHWCIFCVFVGAHEKYLEFTDLRWGMCSFSYDAYYI